MKDGNLEMENTILKRKLERLQRVWTAEDENKELKRQIADLERRQYNGASFATPMRGWHEDSAHTFPVIVP